MMNKQRTILIVEDSDPLTCGIPVIAFTASAMPEDRKRAEKAGCSGIISKPVIVDTFSEKISAYFKM